jgi:anthranilate/para-aminobenzoate synthase component I
VTGAPKQAALATIRRLEPDERGAYCGAHGLMAGERSVFSLLIRTAARTSEGWVYGVGSGVVFDLDPQAELDELRVKLGALIPSSAGLGVGGALPNRGDRRSPLPGLDFRSPASSSMMGPAIP